MTQRPAVLIMQRHLAPLSPILESAYDVYRFWEGPPIEAAHDIRALVVAGEAPLDKALIEQLPAACRSPTRPASITRMSPTTPWA